MKPLPLGTSRAMAEEKAGYWTEQAEKMGAKRPVKEPSTAASKWWDEYFKHRDARGYSPARDALHQRAKQVIGDSSTRRSERHFDQRTIWIS